MNKRELYGLCTGGGSYGNNGSVFSGLWNWISNSSVGKWIGGLFSGDTSDQSATPDSDPNASAATNSGDSSSGNNHNGGAGWGSSGGSGSSGNLTSQEQAFADLYNAPGNYGYNNLIDNYGSNWSGDHGYIDDDGVGVFPGFAGDYSSNSGYDAIGAYQTEQTLYGMGITTTSHGLYASAGKGNSLYSTARNWFYKMHGVNRNARNSKDGWTPEYSGDFKDIEDTYWAPPEMNKYHDNGDAHPEHKLLFSDGREYIYTDMSQNHDMSVLIPMNDPGQMGTYNYVNPMDWRDIFAPLPLYGIPIAPSIYVGRTAEFTIRSTGHFLTDMLPYYIWGNVEGVPNE